MPTAFNEQTGELLVLDQSGKWNKPVVAENPQTKERLYNDAGEWKPIPLTSAAKTAGRAALAIQGVTATFGDELIAGLENPGYAIDSINEAVNPYVPSGAARAGNPEGAAGYDKSLARFRKIESNYTRAEPGNALAINLVSGIPTALATGGLSRGTQAATTGARIYNAAKVGAAYGGAVGFGSGEGGLESRLGSAGTGAVVGATVGAGMQFLSPIIQPIYRAIKSAAGPTIWNTRTSTLTVEGRRMAISAGLDPDQITNELSAQFAREAANAADPAAAAISSRANSLPVRVPLTTGQRTGNPAQQLFEDQALQGSKGVAAQQTMERSQNATRNALNANVEALQTRVADGAPVIDRGQGMAAASAAVNRRADTFGAKVNSLYDAARKGGDAGIERGAWLQGTQDIKNAVTDSYSPKNIPKVWNVIEDAFGVGNQAADQRPLVSKLFQAHSELAALQAEGGVEGGAATRAKTTLDRWINGTARQHLEGDPQAIDRWFKAIGARREFGKKFESGIVGDLIEKDPQAGWRLKVDPQEAATHFLGDGSKAVATRPDLYRDLMQLRNRLGNDSDSWKGVRQEIFLRIAQAARGGIRSDGEYNFSAPGFIKAWDGFVEKNPRLARAMFGDREFAIMRQLRSVAAQTIVKPGGRQLGSAASLQASIASVFPTLARGIKIVAEIPALKGLINTPYAAKASSAVAGHIPQQRIGYGARNILVGPAAQQANQQR